MSDQQSHPQKGRGQKSGPWTYGRPWATNPAYWGPPEPWRMPYYGPYGPVWGAPPMAPPPQVQYNYQGNQAISASQGQPKPSAPSKKSAPSDSKKRKVAEVASGSQPKAGSAKLSVCLLRLANLVLKNRPCNCGLPRGLSLLPGLLGRLISTSPLWIGFAVAWFIITGALVKASRKAKW